MGCASAMGHCPPGMPALPGQLLCPGPRRLQSLPVLPKNLNSSPENPQALGAYPYFSRPQVFAASLRTSCLT